MRLGSVSITKFELSAALPTFPAKSVYEFANWIRLLASSTLTSGVKVAVQVTPPSLLENRLSEPFSATTSSFEKPITASVN